MKLNNKWFASAAIAAITAITLLSCDDKDGINDYAPIKPIGGYNSSKEIAPGNLVSYYAFEGGVVDSVGSITGGATSGTSFMAGRKGQAIKGSTTGSTSYATPAAAITGMTSFTTTMWINTTKHDGGAQCVFMLPNTGDFWGNMFMLIEGNNTASDSMLIKFNFGGQWAEMTGTNRLPNMYGTWKHLAFSYNATTSKFSLYLNGTKVTLPASITDRKNGTNPLGPININNNVSKFIIGGYQQHLGTPWSAPDSWMLKYTGALDEFRVYNKALVDADINALFKLESLGR
jgi:hypothetical protein